tara:strand:- start:55 stop:7596 length:7542 start_codon:yes stop_codon:yes gene_type:complete
VAEDLTKLLNELQQIAPAGASSPSLGQVTPTARYDPEAQPVSTGPGDAAIGPVNIFGGFMRGITGIGRGFTNLAGGVLPYANQMFDTIEDGFQAQDVPKLFEASANVLWGGLKGFTKGFASSYMPPTAQSKEWLRDTFGGETYEGAYELFQSDDFSDAAENLPFLKEAQSDEGVGFGIPDEWIGFDVPWAGIEKGKGLEFTKAGLYSFAFDVFTDPISYLPIGLGGATRGLVSGIKGATQGSKLKGVTPLSELDPVTRTKVVPQELYPELRPYKIEEGRPVKLGEADARVAYNAIDTNPLTYIAKEMGRGYVSAFREVNARAANKRIARVHRKRDANLRESAMTRVLEEGGDVSDINSVFAAADSIAKETKLTLAQRLKNKKIEKESSRKIEEAFTETLDRASISLRTPEGAEAIGRIATAYSKLLQNVPVNQRATALRAAIANDAARSIRQKVPVVSKAPRGSFAAKEVNDLGDELVTSQEAGSSAGAAWDSFSSNAAVNATTKTRAIRELFSPLKSGSGGGLTTAQVRELSDLVLGDISRRSPKATKGKGVKGGEQARPTELADIINDSRARLEEELGKPLAQIKGSEVTGEILDRALGGQYRLAGERLRQLSLAEGGRVSNEFRALSKAKNLPFNPLTVDLEPSYFGGISSSTAGPGARTAKIKKYAAAGEDYYPAGIVDILKKVGVTGAHSLGFQDLKAKASEVMEALTYLSARTANRVLTAEAYNTRLGKLSLGNIMRPATDPIDAELKRIGEVAEQLFPNASRVTKKEIDQLARDLDDAVFESVEASKTLSPEEAIYAKELGNSTGNKFFKGGKSLFTAKDRSGLDVSLVGESVFNLYRLSRRAKAADAGRFADYVDEVILEGQALPKSVAEFEAAFASKLDTWDGDGLTASLLVDATSAVYSGKGKKLGTKNPGFNAFAKGIIERERKAAQALFKREGLAELEATLLPKMWSDRLTKEGYLRVAANGTPEQARLAMISESLLSRFTLPRDVLAHRKHKELTKGKTAQDIVGQKATFARVLDSIDNGLKKKGLSKKNEYRAAVETLRGMRVLSDEDRGEWKILINKLLEGTVEGRKSVYTGRDAAKQVILDFQAKLPDIDLEDVARVIAGYGYQPASKALTEPGKLNIKQISSWLDGKGPKGGLEGKAGQAISQAEKEAMESSADIATSPFHPADAMDTMQAKAMLSIEDRAQYVRNFEAQSRDMISIANANGHGWLMDASIASLGPTLRKFFTDTKNTTEVITQKYFRNKTAITQEIIDGELQKVGIKQSFETLSQYTYFRGLIKRIDLDVAAGNFADPIKAKKDLMLIALRYIESYLALRGIVPSAVPSSRIGALEVFELTGSKALQKQIQNMDALPAFVTFGDIIEVLPVALAKEFWFDGPVRSIPPTVQAEGVRVLVNHMSNLKAGEWFTDMQFQTVFTHMMANMHLHAKKSTGMLRNDPKKNWLEANGKDGLDKLEAFTRYFLADMPDGTLEAPAFKVYERHRQNMLYSSIVLKETAPSGKIIGQLRETWERLLENPIASKETKYAALKEITGELNKFLELDDIKTDFADMLAAQDVLVNISQSLSRDELLTAAEYAAISAKAAVIAEVKSRGGKTKTVDLRLARKEFNDTKKAEYLKLANARVDLTLDMYIDKVMKSGEAKGTYGNTAAYDLMADAQTESGNVNFLLRFADATLRKMSYKYGMETLRPAVGGVQRYTMRADNSFTKGNKRVLQKWGKQQSVDGAEYLTSSMNALKQVKPEDLPNLILDLDTVMKGFGRDAQIKKISENAGKEVAEALKRIRNLKDANGAKIFDNFDDPKMNALADAAAPLLRVFDELGSRRPDVKLLNFYLRKAGELPQAQRNAEWPIDSKAELDALNAGKALGETPDEASGIFFNPDLSPENLGSAWRDMDWTENLKAVNSIFYAMSKAEEWYSIAGEITRLSGAVRVTSGGVKSVQAVPEGFVRLKGMDELKLGDELTGKELFHFLDTENYVYPAWVVPEIENLADFLGAPYREGLGKITQSKFFRRINTVQNFAKQMMTNMRPGNHLMNFMGGVLINDVAGMRNPANYVYSLRLLKASGISAEELGISRNAAEYWMARHFDDLERTGKLDIKEVADPRKNKDSVGVVMGGKVSYIAYEDLGSLVMAKGGFVPWQQSANLDLLTQMAGSPNLQALKKQGKIAKAWNETSEVVGSWAAHRDDFTRMALFIDELKKGSWNSLEEGVDAALLKVNRYHPQPQEVSKFNRDVTRHLILFYTWRAKTLGVIVGDLLERPGRLVSWEKGYYNYQASQGYQTEYFGSHDPKDEALRSFQQNNLGILVGGNKYSISIAHPMWDLMGSDGWLSQFKWDTNEGAAANVTGMALGSTTNILYSSAPLVENLFVNWLAGRTQNGQDLMRGGITEEDMPTILQEAANSFGLNAVHATLSYFYPEQFSRAKWDNLGEDERSQELLRTWFNWSTGARASKFLTDENAKKAASELKSLFSTLNKRDNPGTQAEGGQALSELLDYLGKAGTATLED